MTAAEFKALTSDNLLEPDPLSTAFANVCDGTTDELRAMNRDEFLSYIFEPRVSDVVPTDIRSLFEAGRAAMCYGYFFYPLFMLGVERACSAGEAAVHYRARQLGAKSRATFAEHVDFLVGKDAVSREELVRWDAIRSMRNQAVHPKFQQVMPPGPCVALVPTIADAINRLFDSTAI